MEQPGAKTSGGSPVPRPYYVRIPGLLPHRQLGLGDAIKSVTQTIGLRPCGGCERRAAVLNRWLVFTGPRRAV